MTEEGIVKRTDGEFCEVVVRRKTACGDNCASCGGSCKMNFQSVSAKNPIGAKAGDAVIIEMDSKKVLFSAFLTYILGLMVFIIVFYLVRTACNSDKIALLSALPPTALTYLLTVLYDRRHKSDFTPSVVKICEKA